MFTRQIRRLKLTKRDVSDNIYILNPKGSRLMSLSDSPDANDREKEPPKLKEWRPHYDTTTKLATKLKIFEYRGRPSTDFLVVMNGPWDLSPKSVSKWWNKKKVEIEIFDQRFIKERHEILGSNLAAAHFLVHRGAKVKFVGQSDWIEKNKEDEYTLPTKYEPDYLIEAIDANGMNLYYDGLLNMRYLHDLKFLSLKGCKTIDDWCLDRMSSHYPRLEHLDVSECEKVTERGLEALYRLQSLKTLVITNHHSSPALELTCMMLEDCIPGLKCDIKSPEAKSEQEKIEA